VREHTLTGVPAVVQKGLGASSRVNLYGLLPSHLFSLSYRICLSDSYDTA